MRVQEVASIKVSFVFANGASIRISTHRLCSSRSSARRSHSLTSVEDKATTSLQIVVAAASSCARRTRADQESRARARGCRSRKPAITARGSSCSGASNRACAGCTLWAASDMSCHVRAASCAGRAAKVWSPDVPAAVVARGAGVAVLSAEDVFGVLLALGLVCLVLLG